MNRSRSIRTLLPALLALAVLLGGALAQDATDTADSTESAELPSIAQLVAEHPQLTRLVAFMERYGLLEAFDGGGQFTLFAPSDEAFAALGEAELAEFDDAEVFGDVFRYHVVEGAADAQALASMPLVTSLQDDELDTAVEDGVLLIDDGRVLEADLRASNGVVHVIDAVLLPANRFPRKNQSTIPAGEESGDD